MAATETIEHKFNEGDRVRIVERTPGQPDPKALTYYPFFKNLTGKVIKSYDDNSVALDVELRSLPEDIRLRHEKSETGMRDKWLSDLGEEQREKLSERAKRFHLRYTLLVNANDLEAFEGATPRGEKSTPSALPGDVPARKSSEEIAAAEEEYLRSKRTDSNG